MTEERIKELKDKTVKAMIWRYCFATFKSKEGGEEIEKTIRTVAAEAREEGIEEALELAKEKGFSWCQGFGKQINIRNVHEYSDAFDKEMDTIAEWLEEQGK